MNKTEGSVCQATINRKAGPKELKLLGAGLIHWREKRADVCYALRNYEFWINKLLAGEFSGGKSEICFLVYKNIDRKIVEASLKEFVPEGLIDGLKFPED